MAKKDIECISTEIEEDMVNISEGDFIPSKNESAINSFSFDNSEPIAATDNTVQLNGQSVSQEENTSLNVSDNLESTCIQKVRGLTPMRDDEAFDIKRCYQFRASTIKKLNIIKCNSTDTNIYLNEILDDAICYYYDSLFKN